MTADRLAGSLAVGCWAAELCLSGRGPMGRGLSGRGGGPPGHRAAPSGSRVAGAPRRARRAAGSWGLGSLGCPVAGRWAVSVGLTDRGVVGLRSLICGVLGCGGGLLGREGVGLLGRWGAGTRRAMGRQVAAPSGLFAMSPSPVVSSCCVAAYCAAFACELLALCRLPCAAPAVAFRSLARRVSYGPPSVELLNHLITTGSGWLFDLARSPRPVCFSCLRSA